MTLKADSTTQAAAMLYMALRAILLSGQDQCLDPGKRTERLECPGSAGPRSPRSRNTGDPTTSFFPAGPKFAL